MRFAREDLLALLRLVDITRPAEIDCDEFLDRVAAYLEGLRASGGAPPPGDDDLVHHLLVCPECLEEFEALYDALRHDG